MMAALSLFIWAYVVSVTCLHMRSAKEFVQHPVELLYGLALVDYSHIFLPSSTLVPIEEE